MKMDVAFSVAPSLSFLTALFFLLMSSLVAVARFVIARHCSSLLVIIFVRMRGVDVGEEMKLRGMYLRNARGLRR